MDSEYSSTSGCVMKVALVALLAAGGYMLFGDGSLFGGRELEEAIANNKVATHELKKELSKAEKKLVDHNALKSKAADLLVLNEKVKSRMASIAGFEVSIAEIQKDILASEKAYEDYVERYRERIRAAAKGQELDSITTVDGTTYHDVKVSNVDAAGMSIIHRNGSRRIPFKILPVEMQKHYQFDQDEALLLLKKERERRRRYDLAQALAKQPGGTSRPQEEAGRNLKNEENKRLQIEALTARILSVEHDMRNTRGKIVRESGKSISKAPQYRRQLSTLESSKRALENKIRELRASD